MAASLAVDGTIHRCGLTGGRGYSRGIFESMRTCRTGAITVIMQKNGEASEFGATEVTLSTSSHCHSGPLREKEGTGAQALGMARTASTPFENDLFMVSEVQF